MAEATIQIQLPKNLLQFGFDQNEIQNNVAEWLVLSLFTDMQVSSGKAAELLGISRVAFLQLLRKRRIAYLDYSMQELNEEFEAVRKR